MTFLISLKFLSVSSLFQLISLTRIDFILDEFLCKIAFDTHPDASCILYDDEYCQGDKGLKEMASSELLTDIKKSFGVASLSVRSGCQLVIDTGIQYLETTYYNLSNIHIMDDL